MLGRFEFGHQWKRQQAQVEAVLGGGVSAQVEVLCGGEGRQLGEVSCYRLEVALLFSACSDGRSIMDCRQHELSIRGREREKEMWSCVVRR